MEPVILGAYFGGLGDQLQFSTLPEEFYKQQGRETYLADGSNFRNKEIYDLVWGENPYIKGVMEGERTAGDLESIEVKNHTGNWISNWEYLHGLEPTNIRPKIYYEPRKIPGLGDTILVDLSSITINHNDTGYGYNLRNVQKTYFELLKRYPDKKFVGVNFKQDIDSSKYNPEVDETIDVESIYHYCDLMNSSYGVCCFYSGSMALAAAVQRFNEDLKILCITPPSVYNSPRTQDLGIFYFDYVDYLVTE